MIPREILKHDFMKPKKEEREKKGTIFQMTNRMKCATERPRINDNDLKTF